MLISFLFNIFRLTDWKNGREDVVSPPEPLLRRNHDFPLVALAATLARLNLDHLDLSPLAELPAAGFPVLPGGALDLPE